MINREKISAETMFINLGYTKIYCEDGFFYHKAKNNKTILFNLKNKEWSVYDYDTAEQREYEDEELKAILFQEQELGWISWHILSDYKRVLEEFKQVDHECSRLEQKEVILEKKIQKLQEENKSLTDAYMIQKHIINADSLSDYIPKQKIKDKIEELKKMKSKTFGINNTIVKSQIETLQELIEEE